MLTKSLYYLVVLTITATVGVQVSTLSTVDPAIKAVLKCTASASLSSTAGKLPSDVLMIQSEFMHYDWLKLLEVFPEQENGENRKFCDYIRKCKEAEDVVPYGPFGLNGLPIRLDDNRNIIGINLNGLQLTDSAIGDLSKLPSTLKTLVLSRNKLTKLDVASLPRGLKELIVSENQLTELDVLKLPRQLECLTVFGNKLTELDVIKLPPTLTTLNANYNHLSMMDFTRLPPNMRTMSVESNNLREVDLSHLSPEMEIVNLVGNYLDDAHFKTLPSDRRSIQIFGRGNQKAH